MATTVERRGPSYRGLRMTADGYFQLSDDGFRYELIDGVVCMSPSPDPLHQRIAARLIAQIGAWLEDHPVGEVFGELDVHLGSSSHGADLVYRPDVVFIQGSSTDPLPDRITATPDLVVEIVSEGSRRMDHETKKGDYERCGILEYWLIDPELREFTFYRLKAGHYASVPPESDKFPSQAIPGFTLELKRLRQFFS